MSVFGSVLAGPGVALGPGADVAARAVRVSAVPLGEEGAYAVAWHVDHFNYHHWTV